MEADQSSSANNTPQSVKLPWRRKIPLKCPFCERNFFHKERHREHIRTHTQERPFSCKVCGRRFNRACHLKDHHRIHTGEPAVIRTGSYKKHECEICHRLFNSSAGVQRHLRTHFDEYVFECPYCPKKFKHDSSYRMHIKRHTADISQLQFTCDICNKTLKGGGGDRNKHMRIHTGEKPFKCDVCGKGFVQSGARKNHKCPGLKIQMPLKSEIACDEEALLYSKIEFNFCEYENSVPEEQNSCTSLEPANVLKNNLNILSQSKNDTVQVDTGLVETVETLIHSSTGDLFAPWSRTNSLRIERKRPSLLMKLSKEPNRIFGIKTTGENKSKETCNRNIKQKCTATSRPESSGYPMMNTELDFSAADSDREEREDAIDAVIIPQYSSSNHIARKDNVESDHTNDVQSATENYIYSEESTSCDITNNCVHVDDDDDDDDDDGDDSENEVNDFDTDTEVEAYDNMILEDS